MTKTCAMPRTAVTIIAVPKVDRSSAKFRHGVSEVTVWANLGAQRAETSCVDKEPSVDAERLTFKSFGTINAWPGPNRSRGKHRQAVTEEISKKSGQVSVGLLSYRCPATRNGLVWGDTAFWFAIASNVWGFRCPM